MVQTISKLLGALLAVLLLYIVPAAQAAERQDDISGLNTYHATVRFVDMVRTKGYITPTMYNDFMRDLELIGNTYEVDLEHMHKKYVPDYADAAKPDSFLGNYEAVYDGYYNSQIFPVLFPDNQQPKSDQTRRYTLILGIILRSGYIIRIGLLRTCTNHGFLVGQIAASRQLQLLTGAWF